MTTMTKKRNRSRPVGTFESRLQKFAEEARSAARLLPPGQERDSLMKKAMQTENVMDVTAMLRLRDAMLSK
jgi:hypothetical protein